MSADGCQCSSHRLSQLVSGVVGGGVIAAIISGVAVNASTNTTVDAQGSHQATELAEAREVRTQERLDVVYPELADAANAYGFAAHAEGLAVDLCILEQREQPTTGENRGLDLHRALECVFNRSDGYVAARQRFQAARDEVYIHGSDRADQVAESLAASLPPSRDLPGRGELPVAPGVEAEAFAQAYDRFLTVMCEELPPSPRAGC